MNHPVSPRVRKDTLVSQVKRNYTIDQHGCVTFIPSLKSLYDSLIPNSVSKAEATDYLSHQIHDSGSNSFEVQESTTIVE